jgi:hypothetical protein|tara:strand:- start:712 stop:963 length:252 start_codon:yes stop_codon:yes gene_type:complete
MFKLDRNAVVRIILLLALGFVVFQNHKFKTALEGCIEEVASKCSKIWEYSSELERENERLNNIIKDIKNEMPPTCFTPVERIQ